MGLIGLALKGIHMADNMNPSPSATAAEHGTKGAGWWNKFMTGLERVEGGVQKTLQGGIKVNTNSAVDPGTMNKVFMIVGAVVLFFILKKK